MDFPEIWYSEYFSKTCPENSSFIKSDKNNVFFAWRLIYIYDHISPSSHCATSRKVADPVPDGMFGIFHLHNARGRTIALGSTHPNRK
jgi:hypothetical protein